MLSEEIYNGWGIFLMNLFLPQKKKKFHWKKFFYELYRVQYRLTLSKKQPRKIRNLQRLILTSFIFKLVVISRLLQNGLVPTNNFLKNLKSPTLNQPLYFQQIWEYNSLALSVVLLNKESYCIESIYQIKQILWVFSCLPIQEKLANCLVWECRLYRNSFDVLDYLKYLLKKYPLRWVSFLQFKFYFSKKIKLWLIRHFWIEKKFLISFFFRMTSSRVQKEQLWLVFNQSISFRRLLKSFYLIFLFGHLKKKIYRTIFPRQTIFFIYYTDLLIVSSETFSYNSTLQIFQQKLQYQNAFQLNHLDIYFLKEGFTLFGWKIKKNKNHLIQQVSATNIHSHQLELKRFLKRTGNFTVDQVIYCLNQKIKLWTHCFLNEHEKSFLTKKLNNYLFWRIWYFLRKRHRTKGVKWISQKYFLKKLNKKWIFYSNNVILVSYNSNKKHYPYIPGYLNSFNKNYSTQLANLWLIRSMNL
uniref:Group II intron maturase-specific domain-containing protein n=1 Tax=Lambia antarctica TaxID=101717 RepID=A0A1L2EDT3_9CHLO|nr:hypothetical protein [Lambia antarctica]ANN39013.1 hypothetical protein [Lambia antarctica]